MILLYRPCSYKVALKRCVPLRAVCMVSRKCRAKVQNRLSGLPVLVTVSAKNIRWPMTLVLSSFRI
ncbi:hypothetical protein FOPG_08170 [Fusarium oxysporum f. sp. conglutinans race 2 54008]|uniref:Uncharacterized protein n=2 Tax=Fusarium oxysporum TaxID=5507 RepID=X0HLV0_FUSOX|nr:hypothetical protein FOVG_13033 [Fusarium oxysporum f. sp. pisi HDV247]EXL77403.1 hypothetical protein FOPG_08170 [Fusarium oxysporum f. sp. conglutinans race 2 54008]